MKPGAILTVHEQIEELAAFNSDPDAHGITREVFTAEYMAATDYVAAIMERAGLRVRSDPFGNLFGRLEGSDRSAAAILTGSHIDTTLNAGRYDGVLGVLGAIDAVARLTAEGWRPRRSVEVVCFAGEERRFATGCLGSRALIGDLERSDLDTATDRQGITIAEAMRSVGLDPDRIDEARLEVAGVRAFVELHVEQGTVLETAGVPIGVVTDVAAPHDLLVIVRGVAAHAGATPMRARRDPLMAVAEILLELERLACESASGSTVGTAGVIDVRPGAIAVIPGEVELQVDIRDHDLGARTAVVEGFIAALESVTARRGLEFEVQTLTREDPGQCSALVVDAARAASRAVGVEFMDIVSGAYHDAVVLGARLPIGMIFVPSEGGISHSPHEFTGPEEIECGVRVLGETLRILAEDA